MDDRLAHGRSYFYREEALGALSLSPRNFAAAATRLINKERLANPRHGFFLILRPEDKIIGAPDPVRWIDPLMKHQQLDYRISLLRAAAFHGSAHQAARVFHLVVPRQVRDFELGRHRLQFLYQAPQAFSHVNRPDALDQIKSEEAFANVAGVELTLLDCARCFHKAGGISTVAQIAKDIGDKADSSKLASIAAEYENSSVRRLGFLLDYAGHEWQARARAVCKEGEDGGAAESCHQAARRGTRGEGREGNSRWKLLINEPLEIDA